MKIYNKKISVNHPPFIIAEISANHNNSIKRTLNDKVLLINTIE